jgi:mannose-6-phosphate isomerase-like protein (cupin superfamily)
MRCESGIRLAIAAAVCIGAPVLFAQTPQAPPPPPAPKPAQQSPPAKPPQPAGTTGRPRSAAPDARLSLTLMVTAPDGRTIPGVEVRATGPVDREAVTDPSGLVTLANMSAGTYRLRFDHKEFVPFEKETTLAPGRTPRLSVTLTAAPPPPPAPKPEPVTPPPAPVPDGNYSPSTTSIPDFVESNYIGSAPVKRSPVGCGAHSTATLVQTKDPVAEHTHADADETIYVVAGEGMHRVAGRETPVSAGVFAVVPRGTPHSLTRRGSRPLIFVSTLAGPPCQAGK